MKKILLLIPAFLLAGCVTEMKYVPSFTPTYTEDPEKSEKEKEEESDAELKCTYNFYFSYSHTTRYDSLTGTEVDSPIYSCKHNMLAPLGEIPSAVKDETAVISLGNQYGFSKDPAFKSFLGFSYNGAMTVLSSESKDDEGKLWNFAVDYRQQAIINLYGIWVD